jgi:hypothetical protein
LIHDKAEEELPIKANLAELGSRQNSFEIPAREGLHPHRSDEPRRHSHEYVSPTVLATQNATPPSHPASAVPPHSIANYQRPRSLEHHSSHSSLASDGLHNSWPDLASDRRDAPNRQHHPSSTIRESRPSPQDPHEERRESRHHHHPHPHHGTREQPPIQRDGSGERASGERHDSHQHYYSSSVARERQAQLDPPDRRATDPYLYHNSAPREQRQTQQDSSERHGADHHYSYGSVSREQRQAPQEHAEHQDTQHRQHHGSTTWEQRPIQKDPTQNLIETFTSKIDLQPTFSPNVVRTPSHYRPLARHDSYEEFNQRESPNRAESRQASAPLFDGRIPGLGRPRTKVPQRQSSMPNVTTSSFVPDSFAALPNFVDEPSNMAALSPLVSGAPRSVSHAAGRSQSDPSHGQMPQVRPQTRSQTDSHIVGATLGTINENSREGQASRDAFRPAPSTSPNRPSPPSSSSWKRSPSANSPPKTSQRSPLHHNPLPRPPQETHNPATSAPLPPRIPPPPGTWKLRVRRGFWNRRGDFLTRDGFIVYAPEDKAYPAELEHYPEHAYVNETGDRVEYDPSRPELPESLPQRGRPPTQPYDVVSVYPIKLARIATYHTHV